MLIVRFQGGIDADLDEGRFEFGHALMTIRSGDMYENTRKYVMTMRTKLQGKYTEHV